ncbi:SgcJ/EcaC family oxidoreductase [Kitasatospora sp. NPDC058170]|uniref:SgcJ/EcaC family oxidoreductase n=1 Tax=Kitasatospora sp. NPDC058170 TaxID=3346364 RepID=UPI0036D7B1DB
MAKDAQPAGAVPTRTQAEVAGVVRGLEKAFNDKDPVALAGWFAERTSWTNARGTRLDGRAAIAEFSAPAMKGFLSDSYARYEVVKLLEIAPEVIAVNVAQTPTDADGNPVEGARGAALYVVARQEEGWRIVAGQNNAVEAPAAG